MKKWRVLESRRVAANPWISVRDDECITARDVAVGSYFVVEKKDFAMCVAITVDGKLLLVRQYKHPTGQIVTECPAGYLEDGEEPAAAAARELREETGYRPAQVRALGAWYASPAVLNNRGHLFLCTGCERVGAQRLDTTEDIEIVAVDFAEALRALDAGTLVADLPSAAAVALAARLLSRHNPSD